jgi:hypothetical protein
LANFHISTWCVKSVLPPCQRKSKISATDTGSPGKLAKWVRLSIVWKKLHQPSRFLENILNYQKIFLK